MTQFELTAEQQNFEKVNLTENFLLSQNGQNIYQNLKKHYFSSGFDLQNEFIMNSIFAKA